MADSNDFARLLKEYHDRHRELWEQRSRQIVAEIGVMSITAAPVNFGELRANFFILESESAPEAVAETDTSGRAGIERVKQGAADVSFEGGMFYMHNPTPQAAVTEFGLFVPKNPGPSKKRAPSGTRGKKGKAIPGRTGETLVEDGFSKQAPGGYIRKAVADVVARYAS